ncbi:hypothetical protein V502_10047, partial [Pseudogymnoascus sp. VKM F-4520 (FW-2644)]
MEGERQYWKDHLAHFSPLPLPSFHSSSSAARGLDVVSYTTSINTATLDKAAAAAGVSPQVVVQTAYALVLGSYLGTRDVCFGAVFAGRSVEVEGVEEVVGPCIATLPVRVDVSGKVGGVKDVLQEMGRVMRRHMENEALGLREIQGLVESEGGVFDSLVIWQQSLAGDGDEGGKKRKVELVKSRDYLEFALTLEVTPGSGRGMVRFDANYQTSLFPREMIEVLLKQVEGVVLGMIGAGLESTVEECFGGVQEGVMAVSEGGAEVGQVSANIGEVAEKDVAYPRGKGRVNKIARLVTGRDDVEVSTQTSIGGKVRGWIGHVGAGVKVLVVAPETDDVVLLPLGAEGELCLFSPLISEATEGGGGEDGESELLEGATFLTHPVHGRLLRTGDL